MEETETPAPDMPDTPDEEKDDMTEPSETVQIWFDKVA